MVDRIYVTFDSNVLPQFINCENKEDTSRDVKLLRHIQNCKIIPYICEIAITLESITNDERADFWENYQPNYDFDEEIAPTGKIEAKISMGPSPKKHPGLPKPRMMALEKAVELNFKLLCMTNVGTVRCNEIPGELYESVDESFHEYAEYLAKFSNYVTSQGWGRSWYDNFCKKYNINGVLEAPKKIPESERGNFSKAIAEWVDGDSLAAHYASGNKYFCTSDQGGEAGSQSVFYPDNLRSLEQTFGIEVVTPEQLLTKLSTENS